MPELPEVETYIRDLEPELTGRTVVAACVHWPRTIAEPDAAHFPERITGLRFVSFGRRGKYMLFGMDPIPNTTLIVHLRMTGKLLLKPADAPVDSHTHVLLHLDNGSALHYNDSRKFGRIWLVPDAAPVLQKLGPEPLSAAFTASGVQERLRGRKASIKALLLDQAIVAGVGNIYADEALFRAGLHPARPGGSLNEKEATALRDAVRTVLRDGIAGQGSSLGDSNLQNYVRPGGTPGSFQDLHAVFRRTGEPCPVCGTPVARITLAQRSTHFCPACQPLAG